ncbi:MAG: 50S ribosomal protein L18 [Patescibacteria group bacterium]|nr:50S ribosomal protein L18 [Patescibacteria group bacterium]
MNHLKSTNRKRQRRAARSSARIAGTAGRPRLAVHRTNRFMYAQLIDDVAGKTLAAVNNQKPATGSKKTKTEQAFAVGKALAEKAAAKKISAAVFDRRSYKFHGRVKALADGAKEGGLKI